MKPPDSQVRDEEIKQAIETYLQARKRILASLGIYLSSYVEALTSGVH